MVRSARWALLAAATIAALLSAAGPLHAQISAELAKKCRALMLKAHPFDHRNTKGNAAQQRAYFQECIRRQGDMGASAPSADTPTGTSGRTGKGGKPQRRLIILSD